MKKHYSLFLTLQPYVNNQHHRSCFRSSKLYNKLDSRDSFEFLNIGFLFMCYFLFLGQDFTHLLRALPLRQAILLVKLFEVPSAEEKQYNLD